MKKNNYMDYRKIEISNRTIDFEDVCSVVANFARRLDCGAGDVYGIYVAVTEAINNCILHAYNNEEGIITIIIGIVNENTIEIVVKDKGRGIANINQAMLSRYTTAAEKGYSGMGFTVMQTFMTSVKVDSAPGKGTIVYMQKKINQ